METFEKVDKHTISASETKTEQVVKTYDYGFLKQQLITIQEQKTRDNALRDAEIAEVEKLIAEADKLGIKEASAIIDAASEPLFEEPMIKK